MFYHHKSLCRIFIVLITININRWNVVKNNFLSTFPAFTTVASAIFGRTRFLSHAYAGCVGHTQGTTFTSHASYFHDSIWLTADDIGHFGI